MYGIENAQPIENTSSAQLPLGLHTVETVSCEKVQIKEDLPAIKWTFVKYNGDQEVGKYEHTEFPLKEGAAERGSWEDGSVKPSIADHFMMRINMIVSAINPDAEQKFKFASFDDLADYCVNNFIEGETVDIKLLTTYKGYSGVKPFVAAISKDGAVYVSRKKYFIGRGLVLDESELQDIKNVQSGPTAMPSMPSIGVEMGIENSIGSLLM